MKKYLKIGALLSGVIVTSLLTGYSASAHVLINDDTNQKGAILHIIPDDDPVAGEEAELFLDTQGGILEETSIIELSITNQDEGERVTVPVKRKDSLLSATYTFPVKGVYNIEYAITSQGKTYVFEQTTRISRGVASSNTSLVRGYAWAEGLLFLSVSLLLVMGIIFWNRRHEIAEHSRL